MIIDGRAFLEDNLIIRATALKQHVLFATRRNQDDAGNYAILMIRLSHFDLTHLIQALGKSINKAFRHVLHNDRAGRIRRPTAQDRLNGLRAAGRSANSDDLVRGL